jgi:enamine deaminase RidA (YjgF/YER057c/UK114 family)
MSFFSRTSYKVNTDAAAAGRRRGPTSDGGVMTPIPVNPDALPVPSGYSHGTLIGNTLYLGGQTALDENMKIVDGGIVEQFRQAFGNVLTTLREVGGRPEDLVSITLYLTDIPAYQAHGKEIGRVWRELAGPVYPAMAGIGCTALWQPEAMIEILGVAVIPDDRLIGSAAGGRS